MSRNSKQVRTAATARGITALHKQGLKGPARTQKQNKKVNVWWKSHKSRSYNVIPSSSGGETAKG